MIFLTSLPVALVLSVRCAARSQPIISQSSFNLAPRQRVMGSIAGTQSWLNTTSVATAAYQPSRTVLHSRLTEAGTKKRAALASTHGLLMTSMQQARQFLSLMERTCGNRHASQRFIHVKAVSRIGLIQPWKTSWLVPCI